MSDPPRRIEGFDISNLQGTETVASLVVWEEGRLRKGEYRSFNIRGLDRPDDYQAMRQAVERRYRRRLEEIGAMPDLILIDGGRGQLNAAMESLSLLGVEETPVVALAKREEELHTPDRPEPLRLERRNAGLRLLQQIRDEAHRFAVDRHRKRRSKRALRGALDDIPGVGVKRRKQLLQSFGSVAGVKQASAEELARVLGPKTGRKVYLHLHSESDGTSEMAHDD